MKTSSAVACLILAAASHITSALANTPSDCSATSYTDEFEITITAITPTAKRGLYSRQSPSTCGQTGILTLRLEDGELHDTNGRTAYVDSASSQIQFDNPVPSGGIDVTGWTLCGNSSIALNGNSVFYTCLVRGFYNLYVEAIQAPCQAVNIDILPCGAAPSSTSSTVSSTTSSTTSSTISSTTTISTTSTSTTISTSSSSSTTSTSSSSSSTSSSLSSSSTVALNTTISTTSLASTFTGYFPTPNSTYYSPTVPVTTPATLPTTGSSGMGGNSTFSATAPIATGGAVSKGLSLTTAWAAIALIGLAL